MIFRWLANWITPRSGPEPTFEPSAQALLEPTKDKALALIRPAVALELQIGTPVRDDPLVARPAQKMPPPLNLTARLEVHVDQLLQHLFKRAAYLTFGEGDAEDAHHAGPEHRHIGGVLFFFALFVELAGGAFHQAE